MVQLSWVWVRVCVYVCVFVCNICIDNVHVCKFVCECIRKWMFFFVIVWNANAFFPHFMVIICQVLTYLYMNESIICIHSYTYIVCLWFLYLCALIQMHMFCLRKKVGHLLLHFKCSFFFFLLLHIFYWAKAFMKKEVTRHTAEFSLSS